MRRQGRSYGSFYYGMSSRSHSYRVSLRILHAMDSMVRTGYPVYGSHVVLIYIYFFLEVRTIAGLSPHGPSRGTAIQKEGEITLQ